MTRISMVVAAAKNNVIGKNNQLLWHLPNDLKFFKNTTWGMPVIMGRKTFESFGKPLPGRKNIVITRDENWSAPGASPTNNLSNAIQLAEKEAVKELFIIGGAEIYRLAENIATRIYLTRVDAEPEGDTHFIDIDDKQWTKVSELNFPADEKHAYAYSIQVWDRLNQH